jgi:glutamate--cysteine ligase
VYCLLEDSPPLDDADLERATQNNTDVAKRGREPGLELARATGPVPLREWAAAIVDDVEAIAELIDGAEGSEDYTAAVREMRGRLEHPETTPSARLLEELRNAGKGYSDFVLGVAEGHRDYFRALKPMPAKRQLAFDREARDSLERQRMIEAADSVDFDAYLAAWFADTEAAGKAESA